MDDFLDEIGNMRELIEVVMAALGKSLGRGKADNDEVAYNYPEVPLEFDKAFVDKYHLEPVKIDEKICRIYRLKK